MSIDGSAQAEDRPHCVCSALIWSSRDGRCALCRKIDVESNYHITHHNERTLKASASRGCPVCAYLYDIVVMSAAPTSRPRNPHAQLKLSRRGEKLEVHDFSSHLIYFEFFRVRGTMLGQEDGTPLREVHMSVTSPACFRMVSDWVINCVNNHDLCNQAGSASVMPFRLIDVGSHNPVLVTGELLNLAPYIALSYCWGQGKVMTTTTTNLQSRCKKSQGIPMMNLPKTLQDAVSITRRLKVKYLWIDSLCILQDSAEDWQQEAPKMGEYYRNAYLTLSALDSPDANSGMLHQRNSTPSVHLDGNLYLRPATRSWQVVFKEAPLCSRAWGLQERLISTRVLHYGVDDVFWECLKSSRRESSTVEHTTSNDTTEKQEFFKRLLFPPNERPMSRQQCLDKWYQIVRQYSELKLTCKIDKLPALSGIANRVQSLIQDSYLAGLWKSDLHNGLLWFSDGPSTIPPSYRAPSWSWACLDGSMDLMFDHTTERTLSHYDAEILDCRISHAGNDEFGIVKEAHITMRVLMKDVTSRGSRGEGPFDDRDLDLIVDILDEYGELIGTGYLDRLDERPVLGNDDLLETESELEDEKMVKAIWISERRMKVDAEELDVVYFLLVVAVVDPTGAAESLPKRFERIGVGHTQDVHSKMVLGEGSFYGCESHIIDLI